MGDDKITSADLWKSLPSLVGILEHVGDTFNTLGGRETALDFWTFASTLQRTLKVWSADRWPDTTVVQVREGFDRVEEAFWRVGRWPDGEVELEENQDLFGPARAGEG